MRASSKHGELHLLLALRAKKPYALRAASALGWPHWLRYLPDAYCSQTLSVPRTFSRSHSVGELCKGAVN